MVNRINNAIDVWLARLPDLLIPGALLIACLVFFWHVLWGNYFFPWDFVAAMYPVQRFVSDAIRQGDFPLWNPYVLSGYPIVGDPQASLFYPPFLIVHWLSRAPLSMRTFELLTVLHIALAGVGAYGLGRTFRISPLGSGLTGLTFMLAGFFSVHAEHQTWVAAAAWLPHLLALCCRLLSAPRAWHVPALALVVALSLLAGHTQTSLFSLYLIAAYFVWHSWGRLRRGQFGSVIRQGAGLGVAVLLGVALAAIQLLPSIELTRESFRRYVVFPDAYGVLDLATPLTWLMPKIFGSDGVGPYLGNEVTHTQKYLGLAPLLLLLVSFIAPLRHPATRFFQGLTVLTLLGSFGTRGLVYHALKLLPLVTLFRRPAALFPLGLLGLAVLDGMLLDRLVYAKPTGQPRWVWGALVGAALALTVFYAVITLYPPLWSAVLMPMTRIQAIQRVAQPGHWPTVQRQGLEMALLAASVTLVIGGMWLWPRARPALAMALLLVTYVDLYRGNAGQIYNASPGDPNQLLTTTQMEGYTLPDMRVVYATEPGQVRLGIADLGSPSFMGSAVLGVEAVNGYNPLQLRRVTQYYGSIPSVNTRAFDLLNVRYLLTPTVFEDEPGLPGPFWRFGQWWAHEKLFIPPQALDPAKFKPLAVNPQGTLALWENVAALPRFFAVSRYDVVPNISDRLNRLRDTQFDPSQTLLLEEAFAAPLAGRLATPAAVLRQTHNHVEVQVKVIEGDTLLFMSIPYYPGWRATVDGQPGRLIIAHHAFMALHLTPGIHTVRLDFLPASLVWGACITGLGLLALMSSWVWARWLIRPGRK